TWNGRTGGVRLRIVPESASAGAIFKTAGAGAGAGVTAGGGALLVEVTGCCSTTVAFDFRSELARQISQPMIASTTTPAMTIMMARDCAPAGAGGMYDVAVGGGGSFVRTSGRVPAPVVFRFGFV